MLSSLMPVLPFDRLFDQILVLSLARSVDRRQSVVDQFETLQVHKWEWIDAVDGSRLDLAALRQRGDVLFCTEKNRHLTAWEVANCLTHQAAWNQIVLQGYRSCLVLEDDVVFLPHANRLLHAQFAELPADWDIVYLHSHYPVGSRLRMDSGRRKLTRYVWQSYNEYGGALACTLSARAAQKLLTLSQPIHTTSDGLIRQLATDAIRRQGYRDYIVHPFPCTVGAFATTILGRPGREDPPSPEDARR